jgi:hypothetical protein
MKAGSVIRALGCGVLAWNRDGYDFWINIRSEYIIIYGVREVRTPN